MADLRALFSTNDQVRMDQEETFVNRGGQWETVTSALAEHLAHITSPDFSVQDFEAPRRNVLVLHGVGGIGKTTLSRKLESALTDAARRPAHWDDPAWPDGAPRLLPVRIDLSRAAGGDFEQYVLTLRLALARHLGRALPAFDLALRRYWDTVHPGEPLEEYLRRRGLAARFGDALPGQIKGAIGEAAKHLALPGIVGSAAGQVAAALVTSLRQRHERTRALAGCARLADLLDAEPNLDVLSYYPHLLAWELSQLPAQHAVVPVVLLDGVEDVGDRTHRELERLIQRTVWLMPDAFFVVTGRSRLQWADPDLQGQLDYTGPTAWPGLAAAPHPIVPAARTAAPTTTARQILIGDLSTEDCEHYLAHRLTTPDGHPLIDEDIRTIITARSHGLPLYLDLAVLRYLEIRRTRTPEPADFEAEFPALVSRVLQDLTPDERHVLRAATLLDAFDIPLATRAAGTDRDAPALRLTERPLVHEDPAALWPYHLHALVRSTVRGADRTDDRWSDQDWHRAADRALAGLGEQHAARPDDRALLVGCLRQGLRLARDHRLGLGWLAGGAWAYVGDEIWEPLAPPAPDDAQPHTGTTVLDTPADALVETLSTLAGRQHEHRTRTADRLTRVLDSRLLPPDLTDLALYYRAKAHRDLGRADSSRRGMQRVADGDTRLAPAARRGLAHLARLAGDFPTALAAAAQLGWKGREHRVLGDVWWPHADFERATAAYQAAVTDAQQHDAASERATAQAQLAFTTAFTDPEQAGAELDLAEQYLAGLHLTATRLTTRIAALVRDAGHHDIADRAHDLDTEIRTAGIGYQQATLALALAFHHAVHDDQAALATDIARLRDLTSDGDHAYYPDIAAFMAGLPCPAPSDTRWIDGDQAVRARWRALVTDRRERVQSTW
ncbi:ATP/GTP-binding protein [Kitasatospora sp. NPDC094016]|uniref:ATP/GTP-binding protein n=1 Tax=Kitasatospora sp. NPDC094016 TaxID=3154986 RepID=UPI0033315ED3